LPTERAGAAGPGCGRARRRATGARAPTCGMHRIASGRSARGRRSRTRVDTPRLACGSVAAIAVVNTLSSAIDCRAKPGRVLPRSTDGARPGRARQPQARAHLFRSQPERRRSPVQAGAGRRSRQGDRDGQRMLAIGAATIALAAVGCGDSEDASDRAIQAPDVEVEATPNTPKNGMHGASSVAWAWRATRRPATRPSAGSTRSAAPRWRTAATRSPGRPGGGSPAPAATGVRR
jgi:hypothetical protein